MIIQIILLFGSEAWVVTPCIDRIWGGGGPPQAGMADIREDASTVDVGYVGVPSFGGFD